MEVLIVSKTHMSQSSCVGGLVLNTNRYVRLLNPGNYNQPIDTGFNVGEIYEINFTNRQDLHAPHIEDVIISSKTFLRRIENMSAFLNNLNLIDWSGPIDNVFDGKLRFTSSGTGYIPVEGPLPSKSVGFWIADKDLIRVCFENKVRFRYPNGTNYRNISYVGYQDTIVTIPAGTILRLSLSRMFPPQNSEINIPRGYYLQLSGWYQNNPQISNVISPQFDEEYDDLPF
jgi:ATP-dependent DNA helicase RecQ